MIDDEVVKKHNLSPPGHGGSAKDSAVIFKLASQLKPEVRDATLITSTCINPTQVQTLSLANNNLNAVFLVPLCRYLPNIVNLSLQNNKIREIKEIGMIAPRKDRFVHLRELILLGNPIREFAFANGNGATYRRSVDIRYCFLYLIQRPARLFVAFPLWPCWIKSLSPKFRSMHRSLQRQLYPRRSQVQQHSLLR